MSLGRAVAGASGLVLLLAMFMPWFGGDQLLDLPGSGSVTAESANRNAWESFAFIDLLLFAAGAVAVAYSLTELPAAVIVIGAGTLVVVLVLFRMASPPSLAGEIVAGVETSVGRRLGVFLGLMSGMGIALGGYLAGEVESGPRKRQPDRGV